MKPRELVRSPYVWAFLLGIITLTAIRPFLRRVPEPPPVLFQLPAFSLVDARGETYGSRELEGQVYIASFFFTRCGSICPTIMNGIKRIQEGFERKGVTGVRLVSISVDPEHDTPGVLSEYASRLGVDPSRWTLLTGDPPSVNAIVVDGFKTPMDRPVDGAPGPFDIAHTGKVVLVDGQGRVRGYYGTDELGLDEVYNRAQHVVGQETKASARR